MNYKHLSQIERYQIASLMKAQDSITQIASLIGRHKSTISRELRRNAGSRGYRPKQACERADERSKYSRNAYAVEPRVSEQVAALLRLQWSPEQAASKLPVSHETLYQHVYADKTEGGSLWQNLRFQKQKRKCYASGRDRRGYAVVAKVSNKTADLVGQAIISAHKPFEAKVKTLTYDNGKEFCGHALIDEALKSTDYFARPFASWERGSHVDLGFFQN
jgi:IS30 family transposase